MKKYVGFFLAGFVFFGTNLFAQNNTLRAGYQDLFYSYIKGTGTELSDTLLTNYIRDFFYDVYSKNHQDDFSWRDILNKYRSEISAKVSDINLETEYFAQVGLTLGSYDFEKEGFSVSISANSYLPFESTSHIDRRLKIIGLNLTDFSKYNFFKINSDDANVFLKSRTKSVWGTTNVDKNVSLRVYFRISSFSNAEYINLTKNIPDQYSLLGEILKIEVYDGSTKMGELSKL